MRELELAPPRFKITKLRFGILGRVNTFASAKVLCSATPSAAYNSTKQREGEVSRSAERDLRNFLKKVP